MAALALVFMTSLFMAGLGIYVTSHATRVETDSNYQLALELAEAGANYEMQYVSTHLSSTPVAHYTNSPYTGSISGVDGTFTVYVRNTDGSALNSWSNPTDVQIVSTGTLPMSGGRTISRTVVVNGKGQGGTSSSGSSSLVNTVFSNTYAAYGRLTLAFNNSSNTLNDSTIGSSGTVSRSGGNMNYNGSSKMMVGPTATYPSTDTQYFPTSKVSRLTNEVSWSTTDQVAASTFPNGWNSINTTAALAAQAVKIRRWNANGNTNDYSVSTPMTNWGSSSNYKVLDDSVFNNLPSNAPKRLVFPPGDYYFSSINITSTNNTIVFDNAGTTAGNVPGTVRIWVGAENTTADTFTCVTEYTDTSTAAQTCSFFYNKAANFTVRAVNKPMYAGIYGVRSDGLATVTMNQLEYYGAVIADNVIYTGGVNVHYPSSGTMVNTTASSGSSTSSGSGVTGSWYGFYDKYAESSSTGAVFADGTTK